jgi:ectoine hydroxylase
MCCSQDYGYWGTDDAATGGCPTPDMASCFIAVDRCTRENGCLQLLSGSHRGGRLQHLAWGEDGAERTGVLPETAEEIRAAGAELVEALLEPGDAVFFHSNTLHHSEESASDPRWALCVCMHMILPSLTGFCWIFRSPSW